MSGSLDLLDEYKRAYGLLGAGDRVALQATTVSHGYVYEMRRATYAWFNRWFAVKNVDDDETSQAVDPESTLYVTPTGFVTTSFGGETALSLTRQMADSVYPPFSRSVETIRTGIRNILSINGATDTTAPGSRVLATIAAPISGRSSSNSPVIRDSHAGLAADARQRRTRDADGARIGESAAWSLIAEGAFAERLCATGGCRVRRARSTLAGAAIVPSRIAARLIYFLIESRTKPIYVGSR